MKKHVRNIFSIIIFIGLMISCKKHELPEPDLMDTPEFYFNGLINGTSVNIKAGKNNYYMYSSYTQDSAGVYTLSGDLKTINCNNCTNRLQILINDSRVSASGTSVIIDSALFIGNYPYIKGTNPVPVFYDVSFSSSSNLPVYSPVWNFGDGGTSTQLFPVRQMKLGKQIINLSINNATCNDQNTGVFYVKEPGDSSLRASIALLNLSSDTVIFTPVATGNSGISYFWDFGDGNQFATPLATNQTHVYNNPGKYTVTLKVTDNSGDTAIAKYHVVTQNYSACSVNYEISSINPIPNPYALSNVIVNWTDQNGVSYTSDNVLQPISSYFKIIEVSSYKNNENNQMTKKIKIQFKCRVYGNGTYLTIDNAEAIIAVAYK